VGGASGGGRSVDDLCVNSSLGLSLSVKGRVDVGVLFVDGSGGGRASGSMFNGFSGTKGEFALLGVSEGYGSLCEVTLHFIFFSPLYCLVGFLFFVLSFSELSWYWLSIPVRPQCLDVASCGFVEALCFGSITTL
jgi:hypothetical protein